MPWAPGNPTIFQENYDKVMTRKSSGFYGYKPKVGPTGKPIRNVFRVLPRHPNMPDHIISLKVHFNLGPNKDTAAPCREPYGHECRGCQWVDELFAMAKRSSDPSKAQELKDLAFDQKAQFRSCAQVIDMARPEAGVQPYFFGDNEEKLIRSCFLDDSTPPVYRDIAHPDTGRNIIMDIDEDPVKRYKGNAVRRFVSVRPSDPGPLHDMEWLNGIEDLVALHVYEPTEEEMNGALQGRRIQRGLVKAAPAGAPVAPSPPASAAQGRGKASRAPAPTPSPTPALPAASTPVPAPAAPVPTPPPAVSKKQPVGGPSPTPPPAAANGWDSGYAAARAAVEQIFPGVKPITQAELAATPKPPCFTDKNENDARDPACQSCVCLIPCYAAVNGLLTVAQVTG